MFHGVEILLNYYLSLFMTKRFFAGGMLALLACVSFASCTTGGGEEVQYVKIGQNLCSFLAEGNQPLEIDVKRFSGGVDGRSGCHLGEARTYR